MRIDFRFQHLLAASLLCGAGCTLTFNTGATPGSGTIRTSSNAIPIDPNQAMPASSYSTTVNLSLGAQSALLIDSRSDIFSSGMPVASPERGGVLPAMAILAPGGGVLSFSEVRGLAGCGAGEASGPDGGRCAGGDTALSGTESISGIIDHQHSQFLVGVFLAETKVPAPPALDFSEGALGTAFPELSPALGQTFYLGDGLSGRGAGSPQRFVIPAGATRLYLGYADGWGFQGAPGAYGDNTGGISTALIQQR